LYWGAFSPPLADGAGRPARGGVGGRGRNPVGADRSGRGDKPAYPYQVRGAVRGFRVRNRRFRYTEWDQGREGTELYDEDADAAEMHNVAADPKYAATVKELKGQLVGHQW